MEKDSASFNVTIRCKMSRKSVHPGLHCGLADGYKCLFRSFDSEDEAEKFYLDCKNLSGTSYVPHPKFKLVGMVCLDVPFNGIREFFIEKQEKYLNWGKKKKRGKWFRFIERDFRQIFKSAMLGMTILWKNGYAARNIGTLSSIAFEESTSDLRINFLDICSKEEEGAMTSSIIHLRELMKEVIALSGFPYDHTMNGVCQDVLNFLTNITDAYVEFMDPIFLLDDPWTYSLDKKVIALWHTFMFIEDNEQMHGMGVYYAKYPNEWVFWIKPGSFIDQLVTLQKEKTNKNVKRGILEYEPTKGFRFAVKIGRNSLNHHNETANTLFMPYSTLRAAMANVEKTFNYLCSHIFWFICNVWFHETQAVPNWKEHMMIFSGLAVWDYQTEKV